MIEKKILIPVFILAAIFFSCSNPKQEQPETPDTKPVIAIIQTPFFNGDSAYRYTKEQVDFGPRVPGTKAHEKCAAYLEEKLKSFSLDVIVQKDIITVYDGKKFGMKNVIGQYKKDNSKRILLCAHWDTRPFADQDSVNKDKPFDGADDGAGSVAVLLEVARQLSIAKPEIGIDFVFFDLEDYGNQNGNNPDTWCLGSQYWAKRPHKPDYYAQFGILLDMVGGKTALFPREGSSVKYASAVLDKVWKIAAKAGYGQYFVDAVTNETTDDHVYVNEILNIPTIDIVNYDPVAMRYRPWHHTHADNMDIIDPATLKMVGQVVLEVVFSEANASQ